MRRGGRGSTGVGVRSGSLDIGGRLGVCLERLGPFADRPDRIERPGFRRWSAIAVAIGALLAAPRAEARPLNLGGSLSINYGRATTFQDTDTGKTRTTILTLGQQYTLGVFGDFYRLGGYRADVSWMDQKVNMKNLDQENRFNVVDYRLSLNLFPQLSPLSLTRQQIVRKTDLESAGVSITTKDRVDSFGANWVLNIRRMPRLVMNYQQSDLRTDQGSDFTTRAASAFTDMAIGVTRLNLGYQFSETEAESGRTRSNGWNLDTNSQLTTSLTLTAFARYSSTSLPEVAPGVSFFEERAFGSSLVYRPPLHWWDGSASYSYTENPFFNDFKSQTLIGLANVRYNEKTDSAFSTSFLHFSVVDTTVVSEAGSASLNYRPLFGLSTGVSGSAGLTSTDATGAQDTDSLFQNYQYTINYFRPWQFLQYRAGYQIVYGVSDTEPTGFNSRDLTNTVNLGIDNTNTQFVHVSLNTNFSNIQRITESVKTEQSTYLVQLGADSSYPRNLLLFGDALSLRAVGTYSDSTGFGVEGRVVSGDLGTTYSTPVGFSANLGYRIEDYPRELSLDRQIFSGNIQYMTALFFRMNFAVSLGEILEDNRFRPDVSRFEVKASLDYRIGKMALGLNFLETETRSSGDRFGSYSILAKATRTF